MATRVIMPKLGMSMEEGTILRWLKKEGDAVRQGEPLLEIETDKVTMEVEAPASGIVLQICVAEGDVVPVTETVAVIGEAGEPLPDGDGESAQAPSAPRAEGAEATGEPAPPVPESPWTPGDRIRATPLAKTLARERGLDLSGMTGTGPFGEIKARDVEGRVSLPSTEDAPLAATTKRSDTVRREPIRRIIAEDKSCDAPGAATATRYVQADVTDLTAMLKGINETQQTRISLNDTVLWAAAMVLREYPDLNVTVEGQKRVYHRGVHLGVTLPTDRGAVTPVIRNADRLTLKEMSRAVRDLMKSAAEGTIEPGACEGAAFTAEFMEGAGLTAVTPILNSAQVGAIGIGSAEEILRRVNGAVEDRRTITIGMSVHCRVVGRSPSARALNRLKFLLEKPFVLVVLW